MIHTASFDVFDTVLIRPIGSPTVLFQILGRRPAVAALLTCSSETFARSRIDAERRARENRGGREVTLRQIYDELAASLGLCLRQAQSILEQEITLEAELIRPVPGAVDRVQQVRTTAGRVVFLSDMYLPATAIQRMLAEHGFWQSGDCCYVSGEEGKAKATGELYRELLLRAGCSPSKIVHHGNDPRSDGAMARLHGLSVQLCPAGNLNRYERILDRHQWSTEGMASTLAGASRLARLSVVTQNVSEAALRDLVASVAAPTLVGFTLWVLRRAEELGLRRLYFVSRDGQILLRIAERLAPRLKINCKLSYLYGSRQAWHPAALTAIGAEHLGWIMEPTDSLSVTTLFARVALKPIEIGDNLRGAGFPECIWDRNLSWTERARIRQVLQQPLVQELMLHRSAELRSRLLRYLDQEEVLTTARFGLVDLGWNGRLQDSLARVVCAAGGGAPHGFYFGLLKNSSAPELGPREGYFYDRQRSVGFQALGPALNSLMETFCSADHGLVVGYEETDGRSHPVFKDDRLVALEGWGLSLLHRTILSFADHLLVERDYINPWMDVRGGLSDVLRAFWVTPSSADAQVWGSFPIEDDQGGNYWDRFADRYRWTNILAALRTGELPVHHRTSWGMGSLALTPIVLRTALRLALKLGRARKSLAERAAQIVRLALSNGFICAWFRTPDRPHRPSGQRQPSDDIVDPRFLQKADAPPHADLPDPVRK